MGDAIGVLMLVMLVMAICAFLGYGIAKDKDRDPIKAAIFCALIPVAGIGLMLVIGPKSKSKHQGG